MVLQHDLVVPITITDNETTNPTVQLKAVADQDTPTEASGSSFNVKFDLSHATTETVSVDYAITTTPSATATTAGSTASTIGEDFIALASGTASIPSGTTEGTIAIPIIDDGTHEGGETFTVTLSNQSDNATLGSRMAQEFTITDNDAQPEILFVLPLTINESAGANGMVPLRLNRPSKNDVTVSYTIASRAGDFTGGTDTVTFMH